MRAVTIFSVQPEEHAITLKRIEIVVLNSCPLVHFVKTALAFLFTLVYIELTAWPVLRTILL